MASRVNTPDPGGGSSDLTKGRNSDAKATEESGPSGNTRTKTGKRKKDTGQSAGTSTSPAPPPKRSRPPIFPCRE